MVLDDDLRRDVVEKLSGKKRLNSERTCADDEKLLEGDEG